MRALTPLCELGARQWVRSRGVGVRRSRVVACGSAGPLGGGTTLVLQYPLVKKRFSQKTLHVPITHNFSSRRFARAEYGRSRSAACV